ncbi:hypothetical protein [Oceanobacillus sojae]|uniref:Membrane protein YmcC n=1 Tax=Oceanobacillus sojae TaxID=582851 RepID=A0A511ZQG4_9BACI|nr:hypothetical protein [Oceanobacillus sojae]GEN89657.1 hypothetical protein OSO01_43960 [Oceanobacillus sojae]
MNFIAWMIVACEIGFWIVIILGLFTRYVLKKNKLGLFFLALTPIIDLILLIITAADLYRGATATAAHAIAAVYIGVSIVFGKSMIRWADERFRYYVIKEGPKPIKLYGIEYSKHYLKGWGKHVLSYLIGAGTLAGVIFFINDSSRTEALLRVLQIWTFVLGIDFIISISYFVWPRKKGV